MINLVKRKIKRRPFPTNLQALRLCRVSYSQFGEDIYLTSLLGYEKTDGTYVDIGCFQPILYSNTYIFYQRGWRGLAIDPNIQYQPKWRLFRPEDKFLNYAISKEKKNVGYVINRKHPAMNTVIDEKDIASVDTSEYDVRVCNALPLNDLLNRHLDSNRIDLMSVDCEGMDLEVLQTIDFNKFRPSVIAVEDFNPSPDTELNHFLSGLDYKYLAYIGPTKIFQLQHA